MSNTITFKKKAPSWGYLASIEVPTKKAKQIIKQYKNSDKGGYYSFNEYEDFIAIGYNLWNDILRDYKLKV